MEDVAVENNAFSSIFFMGIQMEKGHVNPIK